MVWNEPDDEGSKDPWTGRKKAQKNAPPDLDEILRKWFGKIFSHSNTSKGSGFKEKSIQFHDYSLFLGLLIGLFLIWALSGFFIVHPAEQAVILQFGKYRATLDPGLHWIPTFIDTRYIVDVERVSSYEYEAKTLTKDENINIVDVSVAVQYHVKNAKQYLFNVTAPLESLRQATASALRQVIGNSKLDDVLTSGREMVRIKLKEQLINILSIYQTGLEIKEVALQSAGAPSEVRDAFDNVTRYQEYEQKAKNDAKAYEAKVVPNAMGQAQRMTNEAIAYKDKVVFNAQGEVSRFLGLLPQYRLTPAIIRQRLYLDTLTSVYQNTPKIFVDDVKGNHFYYLPLEQILKNGPSSKMEGGSTDGNISSQMGITGSNFMTGNNNTGSVGLEDPSRNITREQYSRTGG